MHTCAICGEWDYGPAVSQHRCPPEWEWRVVGEDDDWQRVRGFDGYSAAKKAAEAYDVDSYAIVQGRVVTFELRPVMDEGEAPITRWRVRGEAEPTYYPSEVK